MDFDECCTIENDMVFRVWFSRYRECRNTRLPEWVSSLHPKRIPCRVASESITNDQHGSFNITCKIILDDGEACAVRFPMIGRVKYPDEKLTREVAIMNLICNHTGVPIPKVIAWGVAAGNTLGLGPFLITSYVEGVSLGEILTNHDCDNSRMMREDISDHDVKKIYRQIAHIQLQLSKLNFDRIGSPCPSSHEVDKLGLIRVRARPFTLKSHEILNVGGIDVFGEPERTFSSTSEYFSFVIEQDVQQLTKQLNSVDDEEDAANKLRAWKAMRHQMPRLSSMFRHHGPFKLICDDFGPANMIVNNAVDLQIVAVVDWEWSYAGPIELLWSAPRWLLVQSPSMWEDRSILARYNKYLEIFTYSSSKIRKGKS
ncbi:hypothetical protein Tdes44962_MAKER07796 [Teratosphaeria destructans]|uniref:Aminoglycoside phosphotransferase domain-containing protein n=1 Tax=Teratosphaeria destructans TaxID=418781 RepID=A0A9W7SYT3_9PEZI|nr:hypothetical protein Tdes44962_MAKER07796 [Teratosphaeria destructans]